MIQVSHLIGVETMGHALIRLCGGTKRPIAKNLIETQLGLQSSAQLKTKASSTYMNMGLDGPNFKLGRGTRAVQPSL